MKVPDVIYFTGLVIGLSSASAVAVLAWCLSLEADIRLVGLIFVVTIVSYLIDRSTGAEHDRTDHPARAKFFIHYRPLIIVVTATLMGVGAVIAFMHTILLGLLFILAPGVVFLYSYEFSSVQFSIKKVPFLKDFVIALGWTALILVVLIYHRAPFTHAILFFSFAILIKFFVMAVLYDFKDISSDLASGVRTLPNTLGEPATKRILHILNGGATALIIGLVSFRLISPVGYLFIPAWFYQTMLISKVAKDAPMWVSYILCDLEQFIWLLSALAILTVMVWI